MNGPMGNDLQRKPLTRVFGAYSGTKLGTVRRAQRDHETFSNTATVEGDRITGWTSKALPVAKKGKDVLENTSGTWMYDYRREQWADPFTDKEEEFTDHDPNEVFAGTALEGAALPRGLAEDANLAKQEFEQAELDFDLGKSQSRTLEYEGLKKVRDAKGKYKEDIEKLGRAQGQVLTGQVARQKSASAAGSQGGFQYSGPVERLKHMGQEQATASLQDIEQQKRVAASQRDKAMGEGEADITQAEEDLMQVEMNWDTAQEAFNTAMFGTTGIREKGLDLVADMHQSVRNIIDADRDIHSEVKSSGTYGGTLWDSPSKSTEYEDLNTKIKAARDALEGFSGLDMGEGDE